MRLADPIVDVTRAAALYSQVAGLLAGFAFTALMVYLTRPIDRAERWKRKATRALENAAALSLIATVIAFVIISVLHAILAGGPKASGAGYLAIMTYGISFTLAILSVFYALALLASTRASLVQVVRLTRLTVSIIGPTISMMLLSSVALDLFFFEHGRDANALGQLAPSHPFGFGLTLTGLLFVAASVIWKARGKLHATGERVLELPALLVLGATPVALGVYAQLGCCDLAVP